jgi:hypothetical protein
MPKFVESGQSGTIFNTIKVVYENGMSQRRSRFGRETGRWNFEFDFRLFDPSTAKKVKDEIIAFFRDRKGSYDNFYLPSWELETTLSAVLNSGKVVPIETSATDMGFSATVGNPGNFVYICNHMYKVGDTAQKHEIGRITSIGGSDNKAITLSANITNSYEKGSKVMKAAKVFFAEDELMREWYSPYAYKVSLNFIEDIASLY